MTGLWEKFRPEDLATPEAFRRDPRTVWAWYAWRRARVAEARPNAGHLALARLEQAARDRGAGFLLVTQNVDGLHSVAGSRSLVELHGNIRRVKCFDAGHPAETWPDEGRFRPLCARCGSALRPDVVWFGEALPTAALETAGEAASALRGLPQHRHLGPGRAAASLPFTALAGGRTSDRGQPRRHAAHAPGDAGTRGACGHRAPAARARLESRPWPTRRCR
jgi:NAD-dependent deacetylase